MPLHAHSLLSKPSGSRLQTEPHSNLDVFVNVDWTLRAASQRCTDSGRRIGSIRTHLRLGSPAAGPLLVQLGAALQTCSCSVHSQTAVHSD